jgi:hypothetical protein
MHPEAIRRFSQMAAVHLKNANNVPFLKFKNCVLIVHPGGPHFGYKVPKTAVD